MILLKGEVTIQRPLEIVYDFIADPRNEPLYNRHIRRAEKLTEGGIGIGSLFRNETASMGRVTEWTIEITSYERPARLASILRSSAMDIRGTMTFESVGNATLMHWNWELIPKGTFKFLSPFIKRSGQRLEERNWQNLKQYLESK